MKENHSSQNAQESGTSSFTRLRSKLSFERMVEMGAKMGMENPLFLCHERAAKATTVINGKEYINFSTYDYLDLNTHPEITEAVTEAAKVFGSSAGASRLVGGERPPHRQLERALADFYGVEDCIAYVSGHATNVSTLGFLFGHRDAIFYDGLAHNSLMQAPAFPAPTATPTSTTTAMPWRRCSRSTAASTSAPASSPKACSAWTATSPTCRASSS